jgi:hypothetical protein
MVLWATSPLLMERPPLRRATHVCAGHVCATFAAPYGAASIAAFTDLMFVVQVLIPLRRSLWSGLHYGSAFHGGKMLLDRKQKGGNL